MRPRYYVVKFLKENGLLERDPSYYTVFKETERYFVGKFIYPHKEAAPHLAEDYATACKGEMPSNFGIASENWPNWMLAIFYSVSVTCQFGHC